MKSLSIFLLLLIFGLPACKDNTKQNNYPFIPNVPVSITINLELPNYYQLQTPGAYTLLDGGHRGIFLVHNFDDQFYAVERTCTYQPDDSCSVIQVDTTKIQLRCGLYSKSGFEECCGSQYSFDGNVIQGPSTYALKLYSVSRNGSLLTVRN
ncbi:MAG: hypothetical protein GC181_14660 [Bacteroidetes bacterium]|nr:hypothetical protein [Bacteroidota bacterium]